MEKKLAENKFNDIKLPSTIQMDNKIEREKENKKKLQNICREIPINYIGGKKYIIDKIINNLNINKNTIDFMDLYCGSLCVSYVVRKLYPNINIFAYENNRLLINFYDILKSNYNEFIKKLFKIINDLKNTNDKKIYLKNIINVVNTEINKFTFSDNILFACYYYIINKLSYKGIVKYTKNNTIIYVDPPYHNEPNGYKNYQKMFNEDNHVKLKLFLDKIYKKGIKWLKSNYYTGFVTELYYDYKQQIINVKERINKSCVQELLISSF